MGHIALILIAFGFIVPRWYDVLIPPRRRGEGKIPYSPGIPAETIGSSGNSEADALESGEGEVEPEVVEKTLKK